MRYLTIMILTAGLLFSPLSIGRDDTSTPIHHIVLVWLKDGVSEETKTDLIERTRELAGIEEIRSLHVGTSVPSDRSIVDHSFDFGIHMVFDNRGDMERYLVDKRHAGYVENQLTPVLERVIVYDF